MHIPSEPEVGPYAFVTPSFSKAQWTSWVEIMGGGTEEEGGGLGGKGALELFKVEFILNMFDKAVAIKESGSIRGGVKELEKLLEMFFWETIEVLCCLIQRGQHTTV